MYGKLLEGIGMHHGLILTPENANEIMKNSRSVDKNGYGLVGWMSQKMRKSIEENPEKTGWRVTAFETYEKQIFFVLTIQAGTSQARFLTHLSDPKILKMLNWCEKSGYLTILLSVPGKLGCFHFRPEFSPKDLEPILKLSTKIQQLSGPHLLIEMAIAAAELKKNAEKLTCGDMPTVDDVSVNSVLWNTGMDTASEFIEESTAIH